MPEKGPPVRMDGPQFDRYCTIEKWAREYYVQVQFRYRAQSDDRIGSVVYRINDATQYMWEFIDVFPSEKLFATLGLLIHSGVIPRAYIDVYKGTMVKDFDNIMHDTQDLAR